MVEEAWLDEGDVVISALMKKDFEGLVKLAKWLQEKYPEIYKEYHELKDVRE